MHMMLVFVLFFIKKKKSFKKTVNEDCGNILMEYTIKLGLS